MNGESFNRAPGNYRPSLKNILTFEVEDRFHVENPDMEPLEVRSRIIPLLMHLLDLLDGQKAQATFFVLGWVARKFPEVVALIDTRGHEVASHGLSHGDIRHMPTNKFQDELQRSRAIIEEIIGKPVQGYKAATSNLGREHLALYRVIADAGYTYDCSMYADSPRIESQRPFAISTLSNKTVTVIPQSSTRILGVSIRFGENVRTLPSWLGFKTMKKLNDKGQKAMLNMKLWELDAYHPRSTGQEYFNYSEYGNLSLGEDKLRRLLEFFDFSSCSEALKHQDSRIPQA